MAWRAASMRPSAMRAFVVTMGRFVIVRRSIGEHEDADCDECMGNGAHTVNGTRIMHRMSTFVLLIKVGDGPV